MIAFRSQYKPGKMRIVNHIIFTIIACFLLSCESGPGETKQGGSKRVHTQRTIADSLFQFSNKTAVGKLIPEKIEVKRQSAIKIVSAQKAIEGAKYEELISKCREWNLSNESITMILKHGKPINMHDFHYLYYVFPCDIKGIVQIDSCIYRYRINAGSFFTISSIDSTYYFECNAPEYRKFFLMTGGDPRKGF